VKSLLGVLLLVSITTLPGNICLSANQKSALPEGVSLVFSIDQGFGNGVIVQDDQEALARMVDALEPLKAKYNVCVVLNPMVKDRKKLGRTLDTLQSRGMGFVFDVYSSDSQTLGSCTEFNAPHDPEHAVSISIKDLAAYKKRYGKFLAGLRCFEVLAQDFTVRAAKTTNPEWLRPCTKIPKDNVFQPKIAERYIRFAKENGIWLQWSEWHWFEFASWDAPIQGYEKTLASLMKKYPGVVIPTYANNEPNSNSSGRIENWDKSVSKFLNSGAVSFGLSNQSWMSSSEMECPPEDIILWTKSALNKGGRLIQFEPAWYFFKLPRGSFEAHDYKSDAEWNNAGEARQALTKLIDFLVSYSPDDRKLGCQK